MPVALDPDAAAVLQAFRDAGRPSYTTLTPAEARALYLAARPVVNPDPPEMASVKAIAVPGPAGAIPLRIYTPPTLRRADGMAPGLVFFHGGGWVIGDLDSHDVVCRCLAVEGETIVIAVDYRLAPEHKFPAAIDDAIVATRWIADNAVQLGLDAARISVGGDSAGGNLAAVVAIDARDRAGLRLAGQLLIYPATDFAMTHPSHGDPATDALLTEAAIRWFAAHYLGGPGDIDDWRASPARVASLAGLPPAYVLTAGADPLRDEGDDYAARLSDAGVAVTHKTYPGQFHGFITMGRILPKANAALRDIGVWLKALS
jgi:acetyl esterase